MAIPLQSSRRKANRPCAADPVHRSYLVQLGERVRNARARRGMTRKSLSRDSGVSERYLAQLESGQGNASIILLREITRAMNMPLADLVREGGEPPVELTLLREYLWRLPPSRLGEAYDLLTSRLGTVGARDGRIALIGLRGAGKTTVGRLLADRLSIPFVELTHEVEVDSGMKTDEIFSLSGQAAYRRYERRSLERIVEQHARAVIVTGGGSVADAKTLEMLINNCWTVWLEATPEEHMRRVVAQGDRRPMAGNPEAMDDLRRILDSRKDLYVRADIRVDTTGQTPQEVAATVMESLAVPEAAP